MIIDQQGEKDGISTEVTNSCAALGRISLTGARRARRLLLAAVVLLTFVWAPAVAVFVVVVAVLEQLPVQIGDRQPVLTQCDTATQTTTT